MPKEEIIKEVIIGDKFNPLENAQGLKDNYSFGKKDPFNKSSIESQSSLNREDYRLKALISDQIDNYALISYQGNIFQLKEGDTGGIENKFIPIGVKVKEINLNEKIVVLTLKGSKLKLAFNEE